MYSRDADADRAFFRDVLGLTNVDAGEGWLIFGLPAAEVAMHPAEQNDVHELHLTCDEPLEGGGKRSFWGFEPLNMGRQGIEP